MKIEYVCHDCFTSKIEVIDGHLIETKREYLEKILKNPFSIRELEMDYKIGIHQITIEKQKSHVRKRSPYKIIITAETDEEKKILKERFFE